MKLDFGTVFIFLFKSRDRWNARNIGTQYCGNLYMSGLFNREKENIMVKKCLDKYIVIER